MKNDRHGKAKILTQAEIQLLFSQGFQLDRDRALFGICLFSACRIREACTLRAADAYDAAGRVLPRLTIRKGNTKGKLATRSIPIISDLRVLLTNYHPPSGQPYLFPGRFGEHFQPDSADKALRKACKLVGLIGISTHSFRRTALTQMSDNRVPLRVIQEVSGHRNLEQLQTYIEVRDEQVLGAVTGLSMLSPLPQSEKYEFPELNQPQDSAQPDGVTQEAGEQG
ncbi:MAG: site-specific integrase [Symplocastrum torsivum CPER-KK1]|uniref:Site-specific integrase n=1 Tax=Symplocastrum torsivum CPER-KK1 TaxID=450513 RepID=A0A951PUU4_9CYAN|nr:site-specific integrase [Symplocastrum torsivum CPER-KK1]